VSNSPSVPVAARDAILTWYAANGRRLAFRRTVDPYAILVSEAMAQQTQAARAAAHWERFMARFPTVATLAAATPAEVLRQWQGLGYNRRATALWRTAGAIVEKHGGRVPDSIETLEALPGVGPYTARAVAALAFGKPVGAVDVNVRRVLGRLTAGGASTPNGDLQALADDAVPHGRAAAWTHAVMDIGATLCRPREPRCDECPARPWCRYVDVGAREAYGSVKIPTTKRRRTPTFVSTNRWLRGRILDRLRAVADDGWLAVDSSIGSHDADRVRAAARAMAAEGLIELDHDPGEGVIRARLATA
jgi:A/G-specific adenine glycosylase